MKNIKSVLLTDMPLKEDLNVSSDFAEKFEKIHAIRDEVKKALEIARAEKVIGASLESKITLYFNDDNLKSFAKANVEDFAAIFIASEVEIAETGEGSFKAETLPLSVNVEKAEGEKCERCWTFSKTVGEDSEHPTLCARCRKIIG